MKVQTANGPVELTASMVKPGMRFQHNGDDAFTTLRHVIGEVWETRDYAHVRPLAPTTTGLLGCDPAIASREDCALYGIAPGIDAGAHGFARLRDGGAVDLQREAIRGSAYDYPRVHTKGKSPYAEQFIGLDARYARPEDVRRLCCGAEPRYEDLAPVKCCTLAIGHDGEHEDIATGVRWNAEKAPRSPDDGKWTRLVCGDEWTTVGEFYCVVTPRDGGWKYEVTDRGNARLIFGWCGKIEGAKAMALAAVPPAKEIEQPRPNTPACGKCGAPAYVGEFGPLMVTLSSAGGGRAESPVCRACDRQVDDWGRMMIRDGKIVPKPSFHYYDDAQISVNGKLLAERPALVLPVFTRQPRVLCHARSDIDSGFACTEDKGHTGDHVAKGPDGEVRAAWAEPTAEQRRDHAVKRAIADVPEGCDAGGWANVVRVLAAGVVERHDGGFSCKAFHRDVYDTDARPAVRDYARLRFAHGYSIAEATRAVLDLIGCDRCKFTERLFAAYEAGR